MTGKLKQDGGENTSILTLPFGVINSFQEESKLMTNKIVDTFLVALEKICYLSTEMAKELLLHKRKEKENTKSRHTYLTYQQTNLFTEK